LSPDFTAIHPDTVLDEPDTNRFVTDTIKGDTVTYGLKQSPNAMESDVAYSCQDSNFFDVPGKKVYLYGNAVITYQDIKLEADYIEIDFVENAIFATGLPDSAGNMAGQPVFTEGGQSFQATEMRYNYKTKKGFINGVVTEDSYGFLHGNQVKKMPDNVINISGGYYTTCNNPDHPHFEFRYNKSKVIPDKRIVTGPAYLVVEEVPTPLFIPFGWFPNKSGQRSGIILPTYGESATRGFNFQNMGYYWAINDYLDLKIVGDIYTKGSWALKPEVRYRLRYKFSGALNFSYAINIEGVKETPSYSKKRDIAIRWSHRQDPKARPRSTFSADVNIVSSTFNKYNPVSTQDYLSNTFRSSIAYQTSFGDNYFLTVNASHDQNTLTHVVNVTLPEVSFSVNRFYPFRSKKRVGKQRWYDNISMNYNMNARNTATATDSTFFQESTLNNMRNGIKHSFPISSPIKVLKYFTMTNSLSLNDRMYFESYRKDWSNDTLFQNNDTIVGYLVRDTVPGFNNVFDFGFSSSISTKVYGILKFGRKFPVQAIRHVLTPSVSFSYSPDYTTDFWGYYDSYIDGEGREIEYSKYEGALFGSPSGRQSARINFNFANNLEMKVRNRKDTVTGSRKVALIDNFTISFSYDFAADSLKWSPLSLSGRTRLFKNLDITYRSQFDPYILDSTGTRNLNKTEWSVNRRFFRLENTNWSPSLNYRLSSKDFGKGKKQGQERQSDAGTEAELEEINMYPGEYIDWEVPWDLTFSYIFNYGVQHRYPNYEHVRQETITQTLGLSGNVSITPKWKVGVTTGWDFESNDLSYTRVSIYRDLHCWEMSFYWIPVGFQKSWNFSINAKASILQDLKLTKKKDFWDN
jgi:lipopolysaccharide assembly outer membrane protein LptD (OstA)